MKIAMVRPFVIALICCSLSLLAAMPLAAQYNFQVSPRQYNAAQRYQQLPNGVPYNQFTGKVQTTTTYINPLTGRPQTVHLPSAVSPNYQNYANAGQFPQYPLQGQVYPQPGYPQPDYPHLPDYPQPQPQPWSSYKPVGPVYGNTNYNPLTGEQISKTVTRNPFTGEIQTSAKVINPLTGQESTYLKSYNPLTGQTNGSSSSYNPLTGQYQQSVNGRNPFNGRQQGSSAAYQINPYTGQLMPIPGGTHQWR